MNKALPEKLSRSAVVWQMLAFSWLLLPHLSWIPIWLMLLSAFGLSARWLIHSGRIGFPHWSIRLCLVVIAAAGLGFSFGVSASLEAMVALLIAGMALKLFEVYRRRDALVLIYVGLFLTGSGFLLEQSLLMAPYLLLSAAFLIAALNSVWMGADVTLLKPLKVASFMLLPALPLMLVLFVVFPRIGPLWAVQTDTPIAKTGLSDTMSPGDVSRLTRSGELAFRVIFDQGALPPSSQRYWRALVLGDFDGRAWRQSASYERSPEPLLQREQFVHYTVIQEPSGRPWMFALDMPVTSDDVRMTRARTLMATSDIHQRRQYRLMSALSYHLQPELSDADRARYLSLPRNSNPRAQALADQWWQDVDYQPQAFIQRVLMEFNRDFIYTLEPAALGAQAIDDFLLNTRQGFCEHFAGATAFLLRHVGIPARVVTGYHGGEWNPLQNYLIVRQYDAHAWIEVWLEGQGWVRLDPTEAVAPERILQSADEVFSGQAGFLADRPLNTWVSGRWLRQLQLQYDALNFSWQRWVLNYHQQQSNFLSQWLGELSYQKIALALIVPFVFVSAILSWMLLRARPILPDDPYQRTLHKLLRYLSRKGVGRNPEETLRQFALRLLPTYPELGCSLQKLADVDDRIRYADDTSPVQYQAFNKAIKECYRRAKQLSV